MVNTHRPANRFPTPRLWAGLTFLASAALLGGAWAFQIFGGLQPCALCLYQRWPYWAVIVIAGLAVLTAKQLGAKGMAIIAGLCALIFLAGASVAGFHVGVEQQWWEGLAACGGGNLNDPNLSLDELRTRLLDTPIVRCDDVPWSLLGISLAGYNFFVSLALAGTSVMAARNFRRTSA